MIRFIFKKLFLDKDLPKNYKISTNEYSDYYLLKFNLRLADEEE